MNDPKPGYLTTEFYITIAAMICGLLVSNHVIGQESANSTVESVKQIAAIVALVVSSGAYSAAGGLAKSGK